MLSDEKINCHVCAEYVASSQLSLFSVKTGRKQQEETAIMKLLDATVLIFKYTDRQILASC